ncbi:transposase [Mesobacillus maritimus]|uniref:transposase n=1 Tax=Mesobacillus maritimus TaxID=1643336 RepID=UPI001FE57E3C|nr:transposase [Mesobacillus maritimus]
MPRLAREKSRTGVYHVMLRGINRQIIFEEDEDRRKFLETLKRFKESSLFDLYAYCLMDNHVHLLIKENDESISVSIKRISCSYVHWYNTKYERCGHLFQDRFKSEKIETSLSFLRVLRYIHQNPLKAGLARTVFDSSWTSIHEYRDKADLITIDKGLSLFHADRNLALDHFNACMTEESEEQCMSNEPRIKVSDSQLLDYLRSKGVIEKNKLQQMKKEDRDAILTNLKEIKGVSIRQISRVTGISKSVIERVGRGDRHCPHVRPAPIYDSGNPVVPNRENLMF